MQAMQVVLLAVAVIFSDPMQPRRKFDEEADYGLMQSMREVGLLQPVRVWKEENRFILEDGERRWRVAKRLGWKEMAAVIVGEGPPDKAKRLRQLVANCQREDLTDYEMMTTVTEIMQEGGLNGEETKERTGLSTASISRYSIVANGPPEVLEAFKVGLIGIAKAYELAKMADPTKRLDILAQLAAGQKVSRDAVVGASRSKRKRQKNGTSSKRVVFQLSKTTSVVFTGEQLDTESCLAMCSEAGEKLRKGRTQGLEISTVAKMCRDQVKD